MFNKRQASFRLIKSSLKNNSDESVSLYNSSGDKISTLGFIGSEDGISVYAVVLIEKK